MWECGLKLKNVNEKNNVSESLLMWECGLKQRVAYHTLYAGAVTPYVGVWIETSTRTTW